MDLRTAALYPLSRVEPMKDTDVSCTCARCAAACRRIPGVFHPLEALRAIRAGLAVDLMAVGYPTTGPSKHSWKNDRFDALLPRSAQGHQQIPQHDRHDTGDAEGRCVFLTAANLCRIHSSGFKPVECRAALACGQHERMTDAERLGPWRTPVGRIVISIWREELRNPAPAARRRVAARKAMNR